MPKLTWDEISDLKHLINQIKDNQVRYRNYIDGLVTTIEEIILKHEDENE